METDSQMQIYSLEEVQKHSKNVTSTPPSYWIVIHNKVYDVTTWLDDHPGGDEILMDNSGTDATEPWEDIGHSTEARGRMKKYLIGELRQEDRPNIPEKERSNKELSTSPPNNTTDKSSWSLIDSDNNWSFDWMMVVIIAVSVYYVGHYLIQYYYNK